jgi:hypothetical protein
MEPRQERILRVVLGDTYETDELAHVVHRRLLQRGERTHLLEPIRVNSSPNSVRMACARTALRTPSAEVLRRTFISSTRGSLRMGVVVRL